VLIRGRGRGAAQGGCAVQEHCAGTYLGKKGEAFRFLLEKSVLMITFWE